MNNRIRTGVTTYVVLISHLQALTKPVPDIDRNVFWEAVNKLLGNTGDVYDNLSLMSWDWLLPIDSADPFGIAIRDFLVFSGIVRLSEPYPHCPKCAGPTVFANDCIRHFGWLYMCTAFTRHTTRREKRMIKKAKSQPACTGSVSATRNTWMDNSKSLSQALFRTFAWVNRLSVTGAARAAGR